MRLRRKEPIRFFLLGALTGAGFALLLAPAPGHEARGLVLRKVEHASTATRALGDTLVREGRKALAGMADTLDRIARR